MANATRFTVYVKYNETDKAIRRFKKMTLENGIIKEYYNRKSYEKPSDKEQEPNKTVKMMLIELENILEIEIEGVNLNKKENLKKLLDAVVKKVN